MSDSTTDAIAAAAAESAQADADAAAAAAATEATAAAAAAAAETPVPTAEETAAAEATAAALAAETKKPTRQERHVANLTRTAAEATREKDAALRRAEAAEALLAAGKTDADGKPLTPPTPRPGPATDVETRAAQLVAEREFNKRLGEIDAAGKLPVEKGGLGPDAWETAKATLTGLGAVNNKAFLEALTETENPAKIFAAMADDTDALMDLLKQSPARMATRLGRMDADLNKPVPKPLSAAPKPGARVDGAGVLPAVDAYDPKISNADLDKELDRLLPVHLGGKRKAA
jgi:hypothetical protein